MNVGDNIKRFRIEKGMKQKELAEKVGVTSHTIQNYENNRREPNIEMLKNIANILNASLDVLCDMKEKTHKSLEEYTNLELIQLIEKASKILEDRYNT